VGQHTSRRPLGSSGHWFNALDFPKLWPFLDERTRAVGSFFSIFSKPPQTSTFQCPCGSKPQRRKKGPQPKRQNTKKGRSWKSTGLSNSPLKIFLVFLKSCIFVRFCDFHFQGTHSLWREFFLFQASPFFLKRHLMPATNNPFMYIFPPLCDIL